MKPTLTLAILLNGSLLAFSAQAAPEAAKASPSPAAAQTKGKAAPTPTAAPAVEQKTQGEQEGEEAEEGHSSGQEIVSFGHSATIKEGETVKQAVVFGGNLDVLGKVEGDAVCFGGRLKLGPNAVVEGDAVNIGGHADIDPGAKVKGDTVRVGGGGPSFAMPFGHNHHEDNGVYRVARHLHGIFGQTAWFCFFAFCALLVTVFMPQQLARIEEHLTAAFPRSALMGLAAMVGLPIVTLVLIVTCVGILLVPVLGLVAFVSAVLGYIAFAHILGQRLTTNASPFVQMLFGLLLLQAAGIFSALLALPGGFFGFASGAFHVLDRIVFFVVSFVGLGAVIFSRWGHNTLPQQPLA